MLAGVDSLGFYKKPTPAGIFVLLTYVCDVVCVQGGAEKAKLLTRDTVCGTGRAPVCFFTHDVYFFGEHE